MNKSLIAFPLLLAAISATPAFAQSKGDWTMGIGIHDVAPKSDNGRVVGGTLPIDVGDSTRPTVTFEYFLADNLGLEVIAALPFSHDISVKGAGKIGSTQQLPPTFSLQYHFNNAGKVSPFIGAGLNYTTFFNTKTTALLDTVAGGPTKLKLDDSWGLATHVGLDFKITDKSAIRVDARWIDIKTKVKLNGADIGKVNIDPMVYGAAYVLKF
jgi:outer membrane protein